MCFRMFKNDTHFGLSLYDESIGINDLIGKHLAIYQNKHIDTKWAFLQCRPLISKSKKLLFLVSEILSISCSRVFVEIV